MSKKNKKKKKSENTSNQPSKFTKKDLVEIYDDARGPYNANSHIKFKT